ncbi:hypothetical protein M0R04_05705 [Candidatus Dojkabacteria bacterium]|jgi:hypothetical protein|nr:hypothetical protein [Candidatus Dojkabacteria bacterium]
MNYIKFFVVLIFSVLLLFSNVNSTTYYVSAAGNNTTGLSWANAWTTLNTYHDYIEGGDTVNIGAGTWRGWIVTASGTADDWTVIRCSTGLETNHSAIIVGSDPITGWTLYSGNIYQASYSDADVICLTQGDSLFRQYSLLSSVTGVGRYYIDAGNNIIYMWAHDLGSGYDPDNYAVEGAHQEILHIESNTAVDGPQSSFGGNYCLVYGLYLRNASNQIISLGESDNDGLHDLTIQRCKLAYAAASDFSLNNPSCLFNRQLDDGEYIEDLHIIACSSGYVVNHAGSTHGTGATLYNTYRTVFDSCVYFGTFTGDACIQYKSGYDSPVGMGAVRNCLFTPTTGTTGVKLFEDQYKDSVYSNVFINCAAVYNGFQSLEDGFLGDSLGEYFYILNNTVINGRLITTTLDSTADDVATTLPHKYVNVKYNVVVRENQNNDFAVKVHGEDPPEMDFDSNMYCVEDSTFRVGAYTINLTSWKGYGLDEHSTFYSAISSIGFADYDNGDYTRPSASGEMNLTYGGYNWVKYGIRGEVGVQAIESPVEIDSLPPDTIQDLGVVPVNVQWARKFLTYLFGGNNGN